MNANHSVLATFAPANLNLSVIKTGVGSVTSVPSGIACGSSCGENYPYQSDVTLSILAAPGWYISAMHESPSPPTALNFTRTVISILLGGPGELTKITNDIETVTLTSDTTLSVEFTYLGPTFTQEPFDRTASANSQVMLVSAVSGTQPMAFQWRLNGQNIPGATSSTLILDSVTSANSGLYSVVASNLYGSATSRAASLAVLDDGASGKKPAQISIPSTPTKTAGVDGLVVVTHGFEFTGDAADVSWVNEMANNIQQKSQPNWIAYPFIWKDEAYGLPDRALIFAWIEGSAFGQALAKQNWANIHFIAHSAGARFIESAAKQIKENSPGTIVQCTFLDPYHSILLLGVDDTYGMHANWSDCYFTQDLTGAVTGGHELNAYNVDVDWLDPNHSILPFGSGVVAVSVSHGYPIDFYMKSVTNSDPGWCGADFGFPFSAEVGGQVSWISHPIGNSDNPTVLCGSPNAVPSPALPLTVVEVAIDQLSHAVSDNSSVILNGAGVMLNSLWFPFLLVDRGGIQPRIPQTFTNAPAWLAVGLPVTNDINFVQFDAAFCDTNAAEGLLTVYLNTNQIGMVDERVVDSSVRTYRFALPSIVGSGLYTLSFRLDSFDNMSSSVMVTNVITGFLGVKEPAALGISLTNGMPVLQLAGASNLTYLIESSSNLVDWTPAALLVNSNGAVSFADKAVTNAAVKFYRAKAP
jgi:hypothetical protein